MSDLVSTHKGKTGYSKIETVASTIMTALEPNVWNATAENGHNLQVVNGTKLEITTSKENHQQIVELLKALRRLTDVAVDVSCQLYEADRRFLDKERPPPAGKARQESGGRLLPYVLSDAAAGKLGPKAIPGKSGKARLGNDREADIFSLWKGFAYRGVPHREQPLQSPDETGFHGFTVRAQAAVTADRREVRLRLTEECTDLLGIGKRSVVNWRTGKEETADAPQTATSSATATIQVEDGDAVLVPLLYRPKEAKAKDRVLFLVVRPVIYIEEEERMRKAEAEKAKKKKSSKKR